LIVNASLSKIKPLQHGSLIWHSALELILTSMLLFGITTIVRFVVGPSAISRAFPQIQTELSLIGALVAVLLAVLILRKQSQAKPD